MKLNSVYDLSSIDTLGNMIELSSFKGKYLVIDFWASWCKPCIENIPFLNQLVKHYKLIPFNLCLYHWTIILMPGNKL